MTQAFYKHNFLPQLVSDEEESERYKVGEIGHGGTRDRAPGNGVLKPTTTRNCTLPTTARMRWEGTLPRACREDPP